MHFLLAAQMMATKVAATCNLFASWIVSSFKNIEMDVNERPSCSGLQISCKSKIELPFGGIQRSTGALILSRTLLPYRMRYC